MEKLEKIGVKDEDILFISGVGTHRLQEEEDFENLIGKDFCARFRHQNHYCDSDDFVTVGTTSRGNEIQVNKFAMECDHRILVGGIVFHFLCRLRRRKKDGSSRNLQQNNDQHRP